jgi:mortality factor 4-like protein 1
MWANGCREVEVIDGIQKYFDAALGSLLLYRFERIQYAEAIKTFAGKRMSEVYGAEHLLRLFGTHHTALRDFSIGSAWSMSL